MKEILKLDHVEKYYGNQGLPKKAIDNVSFSVRQGEFLCIMGASGSGKTTLLNCIATIDSVSAGHIYLQGADTSELSNQKAARFRRDNLGFILQDFQLLDTLTIFENIALALAIQNFPKDSIFQKVRQIAQQLGIENLLEKYPNQVSGGEKQRCACARAMVHSPTLILADEPTGALDSHASQNLLHTLHLMNEHLGATILMATHDIFSASFAKRILFLKDGKLFTEFFRGDSSRKQMFEKILDITAMIGGDQLNV